ncbi:MAG: proteasome assembly chaperone family protein [Methanobacteriota archaeon]|nr:MAG: proteasome assembly chaperone family protein [Euryarchaeota archaeon]
MTTVNSIVVALAHMAEGPRVEVDSGLNASGALVVSCFPSIGFVSSIVAHYLVDKLDLELVGGVRHPKLPPVCLVQDGKPLPPMRFYSGEPICNMERCDKIVLIASEIQVLPELNLPLADTLLDWCTENGVGATMLIDSYAQGIGQQHSIFDDDQTDETLLGIGSTEVSHQTLEGLGVPLLKQGVVGGITGVMMGESRRRGVDVMAILAESDGEIGGSLPDARAAARIIECLDDLLPAVHLDPEPLLAEAQRIEGEIREMMAVHLNPPADAGDSLGSMYG